MRDTVRKGRWTRIMPALLITVLASAAAQAQDAPPPQPVRVTLTVRGMPEGRTPPVPVWTGVPLPRSAVKDVGALRLLGPAGTAIPAQFDVQAKWADGSAKWVLVSFIAARARRRGDGPGQPELTYALIRDDKAPKAPTPNTPVRVIPDTNDYTVITGPLRFLLGRQGFHGLSRVWLDVNTNGQFDHDEMIGPESETSGIVAVDAAGKVYTSALGRPGKIEVERAGPVHAVVAFHGDLRTEGSDEPLLDYDIRVHAFAGSSLLRVVLTVRNPRPARRVEDGARWVLGQGGGVMLTSLDYLQPVQLTTGLKRITLSPEPGRIIDRIPLTAPMNVYQDSSGGENWFHRSHVDAENRIPLRFRGYRVRHGERPVGQGLRASPWVDVADSRWAVSAAMPAFWENFPKQLGVDGDGTIRIGLWPKRPGGPHEIQGGEQKTHEFWLYFRHRRGPRRRGRMPLARELMPTCLVRPMVNPSAEAYAKANVVDPILPIRKGRFAVYEAAIAAAVRAGKNLFTQRETIDEYGWRNFGDTWAANERDKTMGPYTGLGVVNHYNNEYDLGFGMVLQAMRAMEADPALARDWWNLGIESLWHEADIDIYHTLRDPAPVYNGGMFTHTAHGVEAGRSTHRASPRDEIYGLLQWPWGRGGGPESGHFRNRGILLAYLLTGDRHLLAAADDIRDLVVFKVANDKFAQINTPNRDAGNNLQILLDAFLLTGDEKYMKLCDKIAAAASFEAFTKRRRQRVTGDAWQYCLFLKSLARLIEVKAEHGRSDPVNVKSFLDYCRAVHERFYKRRGNWRGGSWSPLVCEVMMIAAEMTEDKAERKQFTDAARSAFEGIGYLVDEDGKGRFYNSKTTTMLLQGGGRYMRTAPDE